MRVLRVGLNEPNDVHYRTKTHGDCNCPHGACLLGSQTDRIRFTKLRCALMGSFTCILGGMAFLGVWAWMPVLEPVGNKQVSLAQEMPRQFQSPEQVQNQPFEMNGMWCIIWNGRYGMG